MTVHPLAEQGFRDVAEAYERGRPEYPAEVVDVLGIRSGARVLDLGAGTGKFTRRLREAGYDVVPVEPQAAMRAVLPGAIDGIAQAIPLGDASVDAVTVADAWHWFDDAGDEVARVVRPGGVVALVWQWSDDDHLEPWSKGVADLLFAERPEHPGFLGPKVPTLEGHPAFEGMTYHEVPFVNVTDREGVLAHVSSMSYIALKPPAERAAILEQIAALLPDGELRQQWETHVWVTRRRS